MKKLLFYALLVIAGISTANAQEIFSKAFKNGKPVQITNNRDKGYAIKLGNDGMTVTSGNASYSEEEIWYLVGNAGQFRLYSLKGGKKLALKLDGTAAEAAATMRPAKEATTLTLTKQEKGGYAISPAGNPELSFNMFGGAGRDIKLYSSQDEGSHWTIREVDTKRPLVIKYNAQTEGGFDTNTRIGNIAI